MEKVKIKLTKEQIETIVKKEIELLTETFNKEIDKLKVDFENKKKSLYEKYENFEISIGETIKSSKIDNVERVKLTKELLENFLKEGKSKKEISLLTNQKITNISQVMTKLGIKIKDFKKK